MVVVGEEGVYKVVALSGRDTVEGMRLSEKEVVNFLGLDWEIWEIRMGWDFKGGGIIGECFRFWETKIPRKTLIKKMRIFFRNISNMLFVMDSGTLSLVGDEIEGKLLGNVSDFEKYTQKFFKNIFLVYFLLRIMNFNLALTLRI